jgi:hypothetical protein
LSQSLRFQKEIELKFNIDNVSIDRNGNLFLTTIDGGVHKYSAEGDSIISYSPRKKGRITLIEAWSELRIFLFFRDLQEYVLLDRFLSPSPFYSFNPQHIIFSGIATTAADENIWILDPGDFSLKKYNSTLHSVEFSRPLDRILPTQDFEVTFIKEYQNLFFIVDSNTGIYVMDNLGTYQKHIPIVNINQIQFSGDKMYFLDNSAISTIDIYKGTEVSIPIPAGIEIIPEYVFMGIKNAYLMAKDRLLIFDLIN